jgi:hypothetical protein
MECSMRLPSCAGHALCDCTVFERADSFLCENPGQGFWPLSCSEPTLPRLHQQSLYELQAGSLAWLALISCL